MPILRRNYTAAPPTAILTAYNQPSNCAPPCLPQGTMIHLCGLLLKWLPLLGFLNQQVLMVKCSQFNLTPPICLINMLYWLSVAYSYVT